MVCLVLVFAVLVIESAHGRFLPPLHMKDGCFLVESEFEMVRMEAEAIVLSFPIFQRALEVRRMAPPTTNYLITRGNGTAVDEDEGRVQWRDGQLWLLPSRASDSGEYICTYRNGSYCITGSVRLHVYEHSSVNMDKLSHKVPVTVGERLTLRCPSLGDFWNTDSHIEWDKGFSPSPPQLGRMSSVLQDRGKLLIPVVKRSDVGLYTCRLLVAVDNRQYKVSRALLLYVEGPEPTQSTSVPDPTSTSTSDPGLVGGSSDGSVHTPPPVIVSPLNGTVFEGPHGSDLELVCQVLTGCEMAASTVVTWLVNGRPVESSYLHRRSLQGGRRETRVSEGCQVEVRLVVIAISEEDTKTELKCVTQNRGGRQEVVTLLQLEDSTFTLLVVAAAAVSCFLTVVSVFLYVFFRPKQRQKDYFLARQNSTFSS